ncbi:MAG: alpha-1,4 polygalactosaminidase [Chloroflexi bacterium]|nr:alpha-1,4 polygalactosaminidase [Chloroflexota bacterium]
MTNNIHFNTLKESVGTWIPQLGSETEQLLEHIQVDEASKTQLLCEAKRVLSRCVPPTKTSGSETGLVIGYVQSGKTMSFTAVTTLARDNGYRIVIVVTGTSIPLTDQSIKRLRSDLRLDDRPDRKWWFRRNPQVGDSLREIKARLDDWNDDFVPVDLRQTVLIAVMKHHRHLENLTDLLTRLPLENVPCLIIDDEGDQASLNTQINQGNESTTYRRILELRATLGHRSYLQYTATPQAPLLINIIDILSPSFAEILEPGRDYIGGEDFFSNQRGILRTIPSTDVFTHQNVPEEPPTSLLEALRIFFVGVAVGAIVDREYGHRTMLIHPSHRTMPHSVFTQWVNQIKDFYVEILGLDSDDPDRTDLIDEFRASYNDLMRTAKHLPDFDKIVSYLKRSVKNTVVQEVNASSGRTPSVDWQNSYAHILIGGQAMDRGYTVEGLTVTYMPRGIGTGNADTIQQRARFFGYKKGYLSYCRIYLEHELLTAYSQYVDHEKSIRSELVEFQETDKSLNEWRRQFLLPDRLRPTRSNVVDIDYVQGKIANRWFIPLSPHIDKDTTAHNRMIADKFFETLDLSPDSGHGERTEIQRHMQNETVELSFVYEHLLTQLKFSDQSFAGVLLQVRNYLNQNWEATCTVFKMSSSRRDWLTRKRELNANDKISNLMQGRNPNQSRRVYPGDRGIGDKGRVIVQIHKLNLIRNNSIVAEDVVNVAIWIPSELSSRWLVQDQV